MRVCACGRTFFVERRPGPTRCVICDPTAAVKRQALRDQARFRALWKKRGRPELAPTAGFVEAAMEGIRHGNSTYGTSAADGQLIQRPKFGDADWLDGKKERERRRARQGLDVRTPEDPALFGEVPNE